MKNLNNMFHVERLQSKIFLARMFLILLFAQVCGSCGINKQRIEIQDYIVLQNGMPVEKSKPLNAFVFENNLNNLPIQDFLAKNYKTKSLLNTKINIMIDQSSLTLLIYDFDDFERYFGSSNFVAGNRENNANKSGNINKFIAFSVISDNNDDCLNQQNLMYQKTITYLKNLKSKYFLTNGRY
jgi:hypothetical protein